MSITISIPETRLWDPVKEEFVYVKEQKLLMEHSLLSVAKWEAEFKKPYLNPEKKTQVETLGYLSCMTLTKNVDPNVYFAIPVNELVRIEKYISDPMTATTINNRDKKPNREIITAEILYWQMAQLNIDLEWEKRHFNRLLTLIQVCAIKSQPPKKMKPGDIARQNKSLNAARRAKYHTRG